MKAINQLLTELPRRRGRPAARHVDCHPLPPCMDTYLQQSGPCILRPISGPATSSKLLFSAVLSPRKALRKSPFLLSRIALPISPFPKSIWQCSQRFKRPSLISRLVGRLRPSISLPGLTCPGLTCPGLTCPGLGPCICRPHMTPCCGLPAMSPCSLLPAMLPPCSGPPSRFLRPLTCPGLGP